MKLYCPPKTPAPAATILAEWLNLPLEITRGNAILQCIRKEVHYFDAYFEHDPVWYRGHFPTEASLRRASTSGSGSCARSSRPSPTAPARGAPGGIVRGAPWRPSTSSRASTPS